MLKRHPSGRRQAPPAFLYTSIITRLGKDKHIQATLEGENVQSPKGMLTALSCNTAWTLSEECSGSATYIGEVMPESLHPALLVDAGGRFGVVAGCAHVQDSLCCCLATLHPPTSSITQPSLAPRSKGCTYPLTIDSMPALLRCMHDCHLHGASALRLQVQQR